MRATVVLLGALQFTTGVNLVEVYVSVTEPGGGVVRDLAVGDFEVLENGEPQRIQAFAHGEFPLAVVLAIDRSFSMAGAPIRLARESARSFLDQLRPEDEAMVVAVGSQVEPLGELSRDRTVQRAALESLVPWGTTSLHDAVIDVLDRVATGRGRRAVILLSDGQDRYSRASAEDVVGRLRRSDALVYGITLGRAASPLLEQLSRLSGGRAFHVHGPEQLAGVFSAIATELRSQYLLGYSPSAGEPGWRTIDVRVDRPGVVVRARNGYVAR